ncbi:MAG: hypothetical protein ACK41Z_04225 [Sediminibacterium sp.]
MSETETYFQKIFGKELGEMIQFFVGFFVLMGVMIGFPILIIKLTSSKNRETSYNEILSNSREVTKKLYKELALYDSLTNKIELSINNELNSERELINQKREILIELKKDFDSIDLKPSQLKLLTAAIPVNDNISFREWISSWNQIYSIFVSLVISFVFYILGKKNGKKISS